MKKMNLFKIGFSAVLRPLSLLLCLTMVFSFGGCYSLYLLSLKTHSLLPSTTIRDASGNTTNALSYGVFGSVQPTGRLFTGNDGNSYPDTIPYNDRPPNTEWKMPQGSLRFDILKNWKVFSLFAETGGAIDEGHFYSCFSVGYGIRFCKGPFGLRFDNSMGYYNYRYGALLLLHDDYGASGDSVMENYGARIGPFYSIAATSQYALPRWPISGLFRIEWSRIVLYDQEMTTDAAFVSAFCGAAWTKNDYTMIAGVNLLEETTFGDLKLPIVEIKIGLRKRFWIGGME